MKPRAVRISSIKTAEGARPVGDIEDLKRSISEVGLLHPVTLDRSRTLLAGHHRLAACRALGWTSIPAVVVTLDELRRELVTLGENLTHAPLTEAQRLKALARQEEVYQALYPETLPVTKRGGPGRGKKTGAMRVVPVFSEAAAKKLGIGRRRVQRDLEVARKLDPKAIAVIGAHPIANSRADLSQLARLGAKEQRRAAKILVKGEAKSVKGAIRSIRWADATAEVPSKSVRYTLHTGDFVKTLGAVKAGSVSLVCTDPEWGRDFDRYDDLGAAMARVLKPQGYAVVMIGPGYLPSLLEGLSAHLTYRWTLCVLRLHRQVQDWGSGMMSAWLPAAVFTNGPARTQRFESDVIGQPKRSGTLGMWAKEEEIPAEIIKRFTLPGDLVVDPCVGLGSTGSAALRLARRFVGGDIDAARVKATAARLAATPWGDPSVKPKDTGAGIPTPRWEETR